MKRQDMRNGTYVAPTSSFAGTGGIVDAVVAEAEAMLEVVACFGALFESDFLRLRKPIVSVCRGVTVWLCSNFQTQVWC